MQITYKSLLYQKKQKQNGDNDTATPLDENRSIMTSVLWRTLLTLSIN